MAVGKEIRTQISSVKNTQKITSAMEMVAASKMRRAKDRMAASRPYAEKMRAVISHLSHAHPEYKHPFMLDRQVEKVGFIIISSDRGLCGGLNSATVKMAKTHIFDLERMGKKVKLFCVGKKAYEQLKFLHQDKIIDTEFGVFKGEITYEIAENIAQKLIKLF